MSARDPYTLFTASYLLSSFAGLAALLRSGLPLSWRLVASAFLNSGLFGVAVAMIWCELYGEIKYPWFMLGVSILAGLGGTSLVDFAFQCFRESLRAYAERLQQSLPVAPGRTKTPESPQGPTNA
jgi:hypothetical protein